MIMTDMKLKLLKKLSGRIVLFLILILFIILPAKSKDAQYYKVIKIVDGDTVYIDFNHNNFPNKNERVRINGIDCFENKLNDKIYFQAKKYNLQKQDCLILGYLGYLFAKEELLDKYVKVEYSALEKTDKYNRPLVSIYYNCNPKGKNCKNYEKEILKKGLAEVYTKSNLAKKLKKYENTDLFYININNNKNIP